MRFFVPQAVFMFAIMAGNVLAQSRISLGPGPITESPLPSSPATSPTTSVATTPTTSASDTSSTVSSSSSSAVSLSSDTSTGSLPATLTSSSSSNPNPSSSSGSSSTTVSTTPTTSTSSAALSHKMFANGPVAIMMLPLALYLGML